MSAATSSDRHLSNKSLIAPQLLSCTVVVGTTELPCQFEYRDYVQTLVKLAQVHFVNEHNGDASQLVGLRNRRTNRDLYYFSAAGEEIRNGDVLEGRPYTAAPPTVSESAMSIASTANRRFKKQMGRPGIFSLVVHSAQGLTEWTDKGLIATVQLQPYSTREDTSESLAHHWNASMTFKHPDPTAEHLFLDVTLRHITHTLLSSESSTSAPSHRADVVVGHVRVPVSRCILTPGISVTDAIPIESTIVPTLPLLSSTAAPPARTLVLTYAFHPSVYNGSVTGLPTLPLPFAAKIYNSALKPRRGSKPDSGAVRDATATTADSTATIVTSHPSRGFLSVFVKGVHVCGPQCSKLDGHSSLYVPDFDPIVSIGFEQTTKEVYARATECHTVVFKKKFDVHSVNSEFTVDLLKPMAIAASPNATRLKNGKQAIRYGSASVSMAELLQREGAAWTMAPTPATLGPGKKPPEPGFDWYILRQSDEEVGLVQVQAIYRENYATFLDSTLHPDATYVRPDEVEFNADLIKRNIERLDALIRSIQSAKIVMHELLEWKSPVLTAVTWGSMTLGVWYFPTAHAPAVVLVILVVVLAVNFQHHMRGGVARQWTYHDPDEVKMKMFRSIATLRVVPLQADNLVQVTKDETKPRPLDSYVRIVYEPNFNELPERLIAQTNTVANSTNPIYGQTKPVQETNGTLSTGASSSNLNPATKPAAPDIRTLNNKWFKDLFVHLSPLAKDAVLHDVVEAWKRPDNSAVDLHAFKYPLLQPVQTNAVTELEEILEWDATPGVIRFDVIQDNPVTASQNVLGQVRLPLKMLVTAGRLGGAQIELHKAFALQNTPPPPQTDVDPSLRPEPSLTVRAQLLLRDPSKRVTWKERLASEAMYSVLEMENAKSLSLVEKYHMARNVARTIQHELGKLADLLERIKNLFLWTHPQKTALACAALCVGATVTAIIPAKYFVLYSITKKFTNRFHRRCDFRLLDQDVIRLLNFVSTFPTDLDEQKMFRHANQAYLREKEHTAAQAKLQADWAGYIYKRGEGVFVGWAVRATLVVVARCSRQQL
ncbi:hypothetical protein, variant [Aphanomyces invadans]|uniref:C2 domain-containing protein n=1 Tax=Aphanomyces invadans TaxID=157072 RepID=A0A024UNG3_9STRA|nr:hypothetical protein, variant [Aphanomyces invadans]ETW07961.1 hypothetical protein, variant [Aphanomyces invadans]|eukprot:XP_008864054.1 hypothetical protein, variant [Aphanomyces invadans]